MSARSFLIALGCVCAAVAAPAAELESSHGVQPQNMDLSVRPGDDFNLYANGAWIKATTIPADQSNWSTFAILNEKAAKRTADLIAGLSSTKAKAGSDEQKIGDFYASFMDAATIEAKGLVPLKAQLARIAALNDGAGLARYLGETLRADVDPLNNTNFFTENLFGLWVSPAFGDPTRNTVYLLQGGLGLPGREYYVGGNPKMAALRSAYVAHIAKVLALASIADAEKKADAIMALEMQIAHAHASRTDSEDVLKANNVWSHDDFMANAPGIDWDAFFAGAALAEQRQFVVWQPSAFTAIAALAANTSIDVWKSYLTFHLLSHYSPVLPKAFADEEFAFYGTTLLGAPQQRDRWKRAVTATNNALGWAVGRFYVARYFPPAARQTAQNMVRDIIAAFGRRIDALTWMTPETRDRAKQKLATLYVGIGYPDKWRDYRSLKVVRGDALGNLRRSELFEYAYNLAKLDKPADASEWCMTPQTVNAVNLPLQNALNFPAAILDPPFFDAMADSAFNYGAIGSIIGHEISHSFDDQGSQFDAAGRLANWWTPADFAHFKDAATRLARQYDSYRPFPDLAVNGQQTLSENIADVAGLSAAFDAWRTSLHGKAAPIVNGLTGEQRFFLAYAQMRQDAIREAALRQRVLTDGHAPDMYRAQTVRNIDAWYDAFTVLPRDKLYLPPEVRVRVW